MDQDFEEKRKALISFLKLSQADPSKSELVEAPNPYTADAEFQEKESTVDSMIFLFDRCRQENRRVILVKDPMTMRLGLLIFGIETVVWHWISLKDLRALAGK